MSAQFNIRLLVKILIIFYTVICINTSANCQLSEISIKSNSFFHFKAEQTVVQDANLQGSFLVPKTSVTHEFFLNTAFSIKNNLSISLGLGLGYFNAAYKVNTTRDFYNNIFSDLEPFRYSDSGSNYYALKLGVNKSFKVSDRANLQIFLGGRTYFTEPSESSGSFDQLTVYNEENINPSSTLDYSMDFGLSFRRQILTSFLFWDIGLGFSHALTELWAGSASLRGDTSTYTINTSNRLSTIGIELGLVYQINKPRYK